MAVMFLRSEMVDFKSAIVEGVREVAILADAAGLVPNFLGE
jgi:hypothetical protein